MTLRAGAGPGLAGMLCATFASVSVLVGAQQGPASAPTREEQVLTLVRELQEIDSLWYEISHFARLEAVGRVAFEPRVSALCGNSVNGTFEDAEARVLVRRLGAIYGLTFAPDVEQTFGAGRAVLDGLDTAAGIGFELRGRRSGASTGAHDEAAEETLDEFEQRALAGRGLRVHVDDSARFLRYEGSSFLGTLAYLAGVVTFLNEVTEGEDVELGGLLYECEARALPTEIDTQAARLLPVESEAFSANGGRGFRLEERGTIRLAFVGAPGLLAPHRAFGESASSAAARAWNGTRRRGACVLALELISQPSGDPGLDSYWPDFALRLEQESEGRVEVVRAPPRCPTLLLPSTIDLARPFTLVLELDPGEHHFEGVRLGVSATSAQR